MATDPNQTSADVLYGGEHPMPVATSQPAGGRWISLSEARQIALEVLAQAEDERRHYAESEASRGVDREQYS